MRLTGSWVMLCSNAFRVTVHQAAIAAANARCFARVVSNYLGRRGPRAVTRNGRNT